ncbi:hypothetical protein ALT721_1360049 [Alteromonas alvinellae]
MKNLVIFLLGLSVAGCGSTPEMYVHNVQKSWIATTGGTPGVLPDLGSQKLNDRLIELKAIADEVQNNQWRLYPPASLGLAICNLTEEKMMKKNGVSDLFADQNDNSGGSLLEQISNDSINQQNDEIGIKELGWSVKSQRVMSNKHCNFSRDDFKQGREDVFFTSGEYVKKISVPKSAFGFDIQPSDLLQTDTIMGDNVIRSGVYETSALFVGEMNEDGDPVSLIDHVARLDYARQPFQIDSYKARTVEVFTGRSNGMSLKMTATPQLEGLYQVVLFNYDDDGAVTFRKYNGDALNVIGNLNSEGKNHGIQKYMYADEPHYTKCFVNGQEMTMDKCS